MKKTIIPEIMFSVLSIVVLINYNVSSDISLSLFFSGVIWLFAVLLVVLTRFPSKAIGKFNKWRFICAFLFAVGLVGCSVLTTTHPLEFIRSGAPFIGFFCSLWFYYGFMPEITANFKKRIWFSLFASLALTVMIYIYLPFEAFVANIASFEFTCFSFYYYFLFIFACATLFLTMFLNSFKAKIYWVIYRVLIATIVAFFIQYMFMNQEMTLLGVANDITTDIKVSLINLAIWVLIFAVIIVLPKFVKNAWVKIYKYASVAILGYLVVAMVITCFMAPTEVFSRTIEYYTDSSEQFVLSSDKNVIVVIFDAFDNLMFSEAVKEHPDYMDGLNDFTIYTNTSSVFDSTVTSMNQMFGNCSFDNTLSLNDWLDSGWSSETTTSFYDAMHEDNYICNAYNFELSEKSYLYGRFDNVEKFDKPKSIKPEQFAIRRFTDDFQKLSVLKVVPYFIKDFITFDSSAFKYYSIYPMSDISAYSNEEYLENMNYDLVDNKVFMVNHLRGVHAPCDVPLETQYCFSIMHRLIDELKSKGIYDNSTIIFMADHGWHNEDSDYVWGATPMFLIKEANRTSDQVTYCNAPISTTDMIGTIAVNAGVAEKVKYESSIYDFDENSQRTRYFYDRVRAPELPDVYSTGKLSYIIMYNAYAEFVINGDSNSIYGVDPFVSGNRILPMKEYFG